VIVVFPCCRRYRINLNEPLNPFPFWVAAGQKKAARVEVNISLAFLHWLGIALHPWPFVSDIGIFVLKEDVKLQLTWFRHLRMLTLYANTHNGQSVSVKLALEHGTRSRAVYMYGPWR